MCTQTVPTFPIMILKPKSPLLPEMGDFTLQGTTVGAPDVDLHAPIDFVVAEDREMPMIEIDVSGITTRSHSVVDADYTQLITNQGRRKGCRPGL